MRKKELSSAKPELNIKLVLICCHSLSLKDIFRLHLRIQKESRFLFRALKLSAISMHAFCVTVIS